MILFVDTTVWSLAFRRDDPPPIPQLNALKRALATGAEITTTGLVLQELLQGFSGPKNNTQIIERFSSIAFVNPDRSDHIAAAALRNQCRRAGVQIETIDALLAQLCIRNKLTMLSTDADFEHIASHAPLKLFKSS